MPSGNVKRIPVFLRPGGLHIAQEPTVVTTVLGSCVSVTLFTPLLRVGAICHALLPAGCGAASDPDGFRYLDRAVFHMVEQLKGLGIRPGEVEAKAFGGAEVLGGQTRISVGRRNIEAARAALDRAELRLTAFDLGGGQGRKLFFQTDTGEVFVKRLGQGGAPGAAPPTRSRGRR